MLFRRITDEALAQNAYLIGCQRTGEAIVIDPERDVDRYVELAEAEGLRITAVAETHIHADFLSGARELAELVGARLFLSDEGGEEWRSRWALESDYDVSSLHDGDTFKVGNIEFRVEHTPGHTPEHVSFVVVDRGGEATEPMGILSGDFVFVGDLGRPDLLESAAGQEGAMRPSARRLYASARGFLEKPDFLQVWPAHGAGSACGKALGAVPASTVGYERRFSPAFMAVNRGEDEFVDWILADQPEPPLYFARMKAHNRDGVELLGELPRPERVTVAHVLDRLAAGDAVLDTRTDAKAFMAGHLPGSLHAPLDKTLPTIAGCYVEPERSVWLVVEPEDVEHVVRGLVRIGIDRVQGYIEPGDLDGAASRLAAIPRMGFGQAVAAAASGSGSVLDVRRASEFRSGHVDGAVNIAHTRLAARLGDLPDVEPLLVHCQSGKRAAAAASFLASLGRDVVHVDDDYDGSSA